MKEKESLGGTGRKKRLSCPFRGETCRRNEKTPPTVPPCFKMRGPGHQRQYPCLATEPARHLLKKKAGEFDANDEYHTP